MFDPDVKDKPLPERAVRLIVIGLVVLLIAAGAFFTIRDWIIGDDEPPPQDAQEQGEPTADPTAEVVPPPGQTGSGDEAEVDDWFLYSRSEYATAGQAAEDFLAAVATINYGESDGFDNHVENLTEHTTENQAAMLTTSRGVADGIWRALANDDDVDTWTGHASVAQVWYFDSEAIHFVLDLTASPGPGEEQVDLGQYRVVMAQPGGAWKVELAERFSAE